MPSRARLGTAVLALVATIGLLWWPFDFRLSALETGAWRTVGLGEPLMAHPIDWIANILVTVPLGMAWGRLGLSVRAVAMVGAATSLVVEAGQLLLPGRTVSIEDVIANAAGATLGWLAIHLAPRLLRWSAARLPLTLAAALAWTMAAGIGTGRLQARLFTLDTWSASYPLLIGDETTGDRPWCGRVPFFVIVAGDDRHLSSRDARAPDITELLRALDESREFTLLMLAESHASDQSGPARILTISDGLEERNLTVGQEGDDLIVRVRRRGGGANGVRPSYRLRDVFATSRPQWIAVRLTDRTTAVHAAGRSVVDRPEIPTHAWTLVRDGAWPGRAAAWLSALGYWLILLGAPGLVIGLTTGIAGRRPAVGVLAAVTLAAGCWWIADTVASGDLGGTSAGGAVAALLIATAIGRGAGRRMARSGP